MSQIGHVVINNKWRRSLKGVHTCRDADAGSDHYLVMSIFKALFKESSCQEIQTNEVQHTHTQAR